MSPLEGDYVIVAPSKAHYCMRCDGIPGGDAATTMAALRAVGANPADRLRDTRTICRCRRPTRTQQTAAIRGAGVAPPVEALATATKEEADKGGTANGGSDAADEATYNSAERGTHEVPRHRWGFVLPTTRASMATTCHDTVRYATLGEEVGGWEVGGAHATHR